VGGKFVYVEGVGADYRLHFNPSLSRRNPLAFVKDCYINGCQVQQFWERRGELNAEQIKTLITLYDYTSRTLFMGDFDLFQENLKRLYELEPNFKPRFPKIAGIISAIMGVNLARFVVKKLGRVPM
jgi:hypothetical protein